jgi:ankyrin repeat protein
MSYFQLQKAIQRVDVNDVKKLLNEGASVQAPATFGTTPPLTLAVTYGSLEIVKLLLDAGANINVLRDDNSVTPLSKAIGFRKYDIAKFLIQRGADVNKKSMGMSPLYVAVEEKAPLNIIRLLLKKGARLDLASSKKGKKGSTQTKNPLKLAAEWGDDVRFKTIFLERKVPITTRIDGQTLLHIAAMEKSRRDVAGAIKIIKFLVKKGLDPNVKNLQGDTPLHYVENTEIAKVLIKLGADRTKISNNGKIPSNMSEAMGVYRMLVPNAPTTKQRTRTYSIRGYKQSGYSEIVIRIHETPRQIQSFLRTFKNVNRRDEFMGDVIYDAVNPKKHTVIISAQLRNEKTKTIRPAGAASLTSMVRSRKKQPYVKIDFLTTLEWARKLGVGVGSAIVDAAVKYAKEHGGKTIRLESADTNSTLRFYDRLGFSLELHSNANSNISNSKHRNQRLVDRTVAHANRVGMRKLKDAKPLVPSDMYLPDRHDGILNIKRYEERRAAFLKKQKLGKHAPRLSKRTLFVPVATKSPVKNSPGKPDTPNGTNASRKRKAAPVSAAKRHKMVKV